MLKHSCAGPGVSIAAQFESGRMLRHEDRLLFHFHCNLANIIINFLRLLCRGWGRVRRDVDEGAPTGGRCLGCLFWLAQLHWEDVVILGDVSGDLAEISLVQRQPAAEISFFRN